MADRAGHDPHVQSRPRLGDEADQLLEPAERLLQEVVRVGQPQHLVPVGQGVAAQEVTGGERFPAPGRENKNAPAGLGRIRPVPAVEGLKGKTLVRGRWLEPAPAAGVAEVVLAVERAPRGVGGHSCVS